MKGLPFPWQLWQCAFVAQLVTARVRVQLSKDKVAGSNLSGCRYCFSIGQSRKSLLQILISNLNSFFFQNVAVYGQCRCFYFSNHYIKILVHIFVINLTHVIWIWNQTMYKLPIIIASVVHHSVSFMNSRIIYLLQLPLEDLSDWYEPTSNCQTHIKWNRHLDKYFLLNHSNKSRMNNNVIFTL